MSQIKKEPKCSICRKVPTPDCDYKQGRCPHTPSMIEQYISKPVRTRFFNLLNFFKGNNEQSSRSNKTQKHKSSKKRT